MKLRFGIDNLNEEQGNLEIKYKDLEKFPVEYCRS